MRPTDFAAQLNVSLANGWGIVRTVTDMCMKMPEGKYVLVKDPNKVSFNLWFTQIVEIESYHDQPVIRLYAVPMASFTGEDEDGEGFEEDQELGI